MSAFRLSSIKTAHLCVLLLSVGTGCNSIGALSSLSGVGRAGPAEAAWGGGDDVPADYGASADGLVPPSFAAVNKVAESVATPARSQRQMIYTARFEIATAEVNKTIDRFVEAVNAIGGYLESRNDNSVVVRVPADSFNRVIDNITSLGDVLSRSIKNEDVTRQYRDLKLRIETLRAARQRLLAILETAEKLDDVLKLEEQLRELTLQIETAEGDFKRLGEQVAFSRIEADFRTKTVESASRRNNNANTIAWINQVGVDRVADGFTGLDAQNISARHTPATLWPGAVDLSMPEGFLIVNRKRKEVKAVTSNDAKLWVRELAVSKNGSIKFWADALVNHLVTNRGYELIDARIISGKHGREGRELTFDVVAGGVPSRYLVTLFVRRRPFWSRNNAIRVIEFVAPRNEFEEYVTQLHESKAWQVSDKHPEQAIDWPKHNELQTAGRLARRNRMSARSQSPAE